MSDQSKKWLGAGVLVGLIMLLAGIPFTNMGFDADAFGNYQYASSNPPLKELLTKSMTYVYYPLNEKAPPMSFLSMHRPLQQVANNVAYQLFGWNPYAHFVLTVGWHAAAMALLFWLLTFFFSVSTAWLVALATAFFPAHTPSLLGLTTSIPLCFVLTFAALLLLVQYVTTNKAGWYFLAALLYFLSLFIYELPLALPGLLLLFFWLFKRDWWLKGSWLFFVTNMLFFGIKIMLAGGLLLGKSSTPLSSTIVTVVRNGLANWKAALKPLFGVHALSNGMAAAVIALIVCMLAACFFTSRREVKERMLFYALCFVGASWPVFIANSSTRYFYLAVPFLVLLAYEWLWWFAQRVAPSLRRRFVQAGLLALACGGVAHTELQLVHRQAYTHARDQALAEFYERHKNDQDLCIVFLSTLHYCNNQIFLMASGMMQVMRHLFNRPDLPVYHVTELVQYAVKEPQRSLEVTPAANGFRFTSPDPDNLFIMSAQCLSCHEAVPYSMGTLVVHRKTASWKITDMSCFFAQEWIDRFKKHKQVVFVTWDARNWKFVELHHLR